MFIRRLDNIEKALVDLCWYLVHWELEVHLIVLEGYQQQNIHFLFSTTCACLDGNLHRGGRKVQSRPWRCGTSRPSRCTASCRGLIASYTLSLSNPGNSVTIYNSGMNVDNCNLNPLLDDEGAGLEPLVQLLYHLRFKVLKKMFLIFSMLQSIASF